METKTGEIDHYRSMLFTVAYNMLGSIDDANDMVQDTFTSWLAADKSHVLNAQYYLLRSIINKCIDQLNQLKKQRMAYPGTWLPEPVYSATPEESDYLNGQKLSIGFLYLLEKLTPMERGVFILKESFDMSYEQLASIFAIGQPACRQHLSRAKKKLLVNKAKFEPDNDQQEKILQEFLNACLTKNLQELIRLLREDVVVYADGGGKARAALQPVYGKEKIMKSLVTNFAKADVFMAVNILSLNGFSGAALYSDSANLIPTVLIAIDLDEVAQIATIYFLANPDKLRSGKA